MYRKKRGVAKAKLTWSDKAFAANPMINIPIPQRDDLRPNLFLINVNNMPGLPSLNSDIVPEAPIELVKEPVKKRAYKRKEMVVDPITSTSDKNMTLRSRKDTTKPVEKVKRLKKTFVAAIIKSPDKEKRVRGRPRKNGPALSLE